MLKPPNAQKLQEIENSYINGQKRQMVNQIKAYGVKAFMIDYFDECYMPLIADREANSNYPSIVRMFFLLKDN